MLFPQKEPEVIIPEKKSFEKDSRFFRGIKGKKDKSRITEGMGRRNWGN